MANEKPKLAISFSGGKTSAYMTEKLLEKHSKTHDIRVTFANTGKEAPEALEFVDNCDRLKFGGRVIWLEAVVDPEHGKGIRHKVVDFQSAARNGEPFRQVIAKYGIPGPAHPQCSDRLKRQVMESYFESIGWRPTTRNPLYDTAIGIRSDEADRMHPNRKELRLIYPLVNWCVRKEHVNKALQSWPFQLGHEEHIGNCVTCWKKTIRKLATVYQERPGEFDFNREMESKYGPLKAENEHGERRFFRGYRKVDDIQSIAESPNFTPWSPSLESQLMLFSPDLDVPAGPCGSGESCEVY